MTSAAKGKRVPRDASGGHRGARSTSADHTGNLPLMNAFTAATDYWIDAVQRSVMFFDVLRQRGNNYFEHEAAGKPPLLGFGYEVVIDGRDLERRVNYMLLRVVPKPQHKANPKKRPIVVIDPRAGHGPGIGGMHEESQVGEALRAGHPVYFVAFHPDPEPGQTIREILRAQARFLEEVERRHPKTPKPFTIANCQAGWALAMLAAAYPELKGPMVLSGSPLAYWSGDDQLSSMRYFSGPLGGGWITSLLGDLGNGTVDGAYLATNFERLNPANTLWSKQYNLYSKIDTEPPRYLKFERWWNGFFQHRTEEMEVIVQNGQTLIYVLHEKIGHLGIFVSSKVARKEHNAIINTLEFIDMIPPGLYEMVVESEPLPDPSDGRRAEYPARLYETPVESEHLPDGSRDRLDEYTVRFEERTIDDLRKLGGDRAIEPAFDTQRQVSEFNTKLYTSFVRPWVRLFSNGWNARMVSQSLPARAQHLWFSDRNPWMAPVKAMAETARANRRPVPPGNPFTQIEREVSRDIVDVLKALGNLQDTWMRLFFNAAYGPLGLGMLFPPTRTVPAAPPDRRSQEQLSSLIGQLQDMVEQGGFVEAVARTVLLLELADGDIEPGYAGEATAEMDPRVAKLDGAQLKQLFREQYYVLLVAREQAIAALPKLLPAVKDRREALQLAKRVVLRGNQPNVPERAMLEELTGLLELTSQNGEADEQRADE